MDSTGPEEAFEVRLREAAGEDLELLVERHAAKMDAGQARKVLKNPFVTGAVIARLAAERHLAAVYEVRRDVVLLPSSPRTLVLDWLTGLFWPDLVRAGRDIRLHPTVRRSADLRLLERLQGFSLGEKLVLARTASAGVLGHLRNDPSPRVVAALLENPRLTESLLAPLLGSDASSPKTLAVVAASPRWTSRYGVRLALVRNPRTPVASALQLLPMIKKSDLQAVAADLRLDGVVRQRGRLLSGGGRGDGRGSTIDRSPRCR
jgi:hypothetical protein